MGVETETTIVVVPDSESGAIDLGGNEGEGGDTETGGEESGEVAVAQIEGETAVAIAAIAADTEQQRIEADLERERIWAERNERITTLETNMRELERENSELRERLSLAEASQSTPIVEAEAVAEAVAEAAEPMLSEPNLTQEYIAENEPPKDDGPSDAGESPVAVAVVIPARRKRRLI
jgi:hypothetical protein